MSEDDALASWRANPFFVLEVKIDATRADIERAGQRVLAQLSIGAQGASDYATPLGKCRRDADMVRQALVALRDPSQRLVHELWANIAPLNKSALRQKPAPKWEHAESGLGWARQ